MNIYHQVIFFIIGIILLYIFIQYCEHPYHMPIPVKESFTSPVVEPETREWSSVYAKLYDKVFSADEYYEKESQLIESVLRGRGVYPWSRGVELGCGTGRNYQFLRKGGPILGIDMNRSMIEIAQTRNPTGDFMKADIRQKDLIPIGSVDIVFLLGETLYLNSGRDQFVILREIRRWMKKGGFLVMTYWDSKDLDPAPQPYSQIIDGEHAVTYFENLQHEAWFEPRKEIGEGVFDYEERYTLTAGDGSVKTNEESHRVYLPPTRKVMMELLDQTGWKVVEMKGLEKIGMKDRELFFLQQK